MAAFEAKNILSKVLMLPPLSSHFLLLSKFYSSAWRVSWDGCKNKLGACGAGDIHCLCQTLDAGSQVSCYYLFLTEIIIGGKQEPTILWRPSGLSLFLRGATKLTTMMLRR